MPEQMGKGLSKKKLLFALVDLWGAYGGDWVRVRDALVGRFPGYEKAIDQFLSNTARNTDSIQFLTKANYDPDSKDMNKKATLLALCKNLKKRADESSDPEFVEGVDRYLETVVEALKS